MLVKVSESISLLGINAKVAMMSEEEVNDFLSTVSSEDVAKVAQILANPEKTAGAVSKAVGTLLAILAIALPSLGGTAKRETGEKLMELKNKGDLTIEQITDFKQDLPKESLSVGQKALANLNKLIAKARRAAVDPNFSGFATIGGEKLSAANQAELDALEAIRDLAKSMAAAKHLDKAVYDAQVKKMVDAFKSKKDVVF